MRPFTVRQTIDVPREQVFDYLVDVANYAQFSDHYLGDLRLGRQDSRGIGASFSFRLKYVFGRQWGDLALVETEHPHLIDAQGRFGRLGRVPIEARYTLTTAGQGMTRIEYRFESSPTKPIDRMREGFGMRIWMKFQARRALHRLAQVVELGKTSAQPISSAAG